MSTELIGVKNNSQPEEISQDEIPGQDGYEDSLDLDIETTGGFDGDLGLDGSFYEDGDSFGDPSGGFGATEEGLTQWLQELLDSEQITQGQFNDYMGRIAQTAGYSPAGRQEALSALYNELSAAYADDMGDDLDVFGADGVEGMGLSPEQIEEFITRVQESELDQGTKDDLISQAETIRAQLEGIKNEDEEAMISLEDQFDALETAFDTLLQMPPEATEMASELRIEPTELATKASEFGIDLKNLPSPPTTEFMQFLAALNPEIGEMVEEIKSLTKKKAADVQENGKKAVEISQGNVDNGTTNSNDNKNWAPHQYLYDAAHFQTDEDKKIRRLSEKIRKKVIDMLDPFYPDGKIKKVRPESFDLVQTRTEDSLIGEVTYHGNEWRTEYERHLAADQIVFEDAEGDETILDIINATTGDIQVMEAGSDRPPDIQTVQVEVDREGDGSWNSPPILTYDPNDKGWHNYDPDA